MSSRTRFVVSLLALAFAIYTLIEQPTRLGLDLRGGTQVVLDLSPRPGQEVTSDLAQRTQEIIRRTCDPLGVSEPNVAIEQDPHFG